MDLWIIAAMTFQTGKVIHCGYMARSAGGAVVVEHILTTNPRMCSKSSGRPARGGMTLVTGSSKCARVESRFFMA